MPKCKEENEMINYETMWFFLEMNDVIKSWKPRKSRILVNFKSDPSDMLYIEIGLKSALRNH